MPTYGLKYQTQFTSQSDDNNVELDYTLQFLFKDYVGEVASLIGAETTVTKRCTVDDPVAPIKGQSLDISIINKGNIPITSFQSDDDDGVQVQLLQGANLLFIGYLVQDDFYELKIDPGHPITLSANDNLGLLKGVVLSEADVSNAYSVILLEFVGLLDLFYVSVADSSFNPVVGGTIEVAGIVYDITSVTGPFNLVIGAVNYNYLIEVTPNTPGWAEVTETVILTGPLNLLNRNRLIDMIYACINQTNLPLLTNIYFNLFEYRQNPLRSTFEQTLIDSQTFIKGDTYEDCYSVLTKILQTFDCTLFQANGQWNIIHWYEAKYYGNAIPGFVYDEQFKYLGNALLNNTFFIGPGTQLTRPITGLTEGALRGLKFTKKTFEYKQPKYLLRNNDLQYLGNLLRTYLSGTTQISEYVAVDWQGTYGAPNVTRFIRVEVDTLINLERARYMVLYGPTFDTNLSLPSLPIECQAGDRISFACGFRTNISQLGVSVSFGIQLTDGTLTYYLADDLSWSGAPGYTFTYPAGGNSNVWESIDTGQSDPMPISGIMTVFLPQITNGTQDSSKESHFKDMRFTYIPYVDDSTKVIGQQHSQTRPTGPKLFSEVDIYIDDSPRNSIAGTLFLNTKTGLLQDRTLYWRYPPDANGWRLGELTTLELLVWRAKTRSKFEGGFIGNYQNSLPISLLAIAIFDFYPTKNYTFGLLSIDYKRNQCSGTLWEMYDNNDAVLIPEYLFKYLYDAD